MVKQKIWTRPESRRSVCITAPTAALTGPRIEWSEEDQCFVGSSRGMIYGGCHGQDEKAPTSGRDYVNKMQDVA